MLNHRDQHLKIKIQSTFLNIKTCYKFNISKLSKMLFFENLFIYLKQQIHDLIF